MKFSFKKSLLITLIIVELTAVMAVAGVSVVSANPDPVEKPALRPKVTISFEIARRRDCMGFGICDFELGISFEKINYATGTLYLDEVNKNNFVIEIIKEKGISAAGYDKYLKSGTFLMEDESPIPDEYLKALGVKGSRTFLAGKHKITERNGLIYISIPVR